MYSYTSNIFLKTIYNEVPTEIELSTGASRVSTLAQKPPWKQRHFKGWRFGILTGSVLASLILAINVAATIYGGVRPVRNDNGKKVIFEGNCEQVRKINTTVHVWINILSTLLLSASNYAMQCLSAPTRQEVDAAHEKRHWLDIGVLSTRNIRRISVKRAFLWAVLGLSSMPLHLLSELLRSGIPLFSTLTSTQLQFRRIPVDIRSRLCHFHCDRGSTIQ
jgi:hypothetical protein